MSDDLHITPGTAWRAGWEGVLVRLPSGKVAKLRDVTVDLMIQLGRIPDSLTPLVLDLFKTGGDVDLPAIETLADVQQRLTFRDAVVRCAFVEPRIVDDPKADDEIPLQSVSAEDRWYVFSFLGRPVRDLESFRGEQTDAVDAVGAPAGNRKGRKRPARSAPVGAEDVPA